MTMIKLHFEANKDFITKNLCINRFDPDSECKGKCILMQKLSSETEKEAESKAIYNPVASFSFFTELLVKIKFNNPEIFHFTKKIPEINIVVLEGFAKRVFQPPEFVI